MRTQSTTLERHPELDHDEEVWVALHRADHPRHGRRLRPRLRVCGRDDAAWEHAAATSSSSSDVLPALDELRAHRLKLGPRLEHRAQPRRVRQRTTRLDVDAALSSGTHGKTKPHPTIFRAALERLEVEPAAAVMVGDSIEDDVEGANAVGMRGLLLDRENRYPEVAVKLTDLRELPAALGLN